MLPAEVPADAVAARRADLASSTSRNLNTPSYTSPASCAREGFDWPANLPREAGEDKGGGAAALCRHISWITHMTPSMLPRISPFQNRSTSQPRLRNWSLATSRNESACCPPSASMASFSRTQAKSRTYGGTGCCRRKCQPTPWRRRRDQRSFSAGVAARRADLASSTSCDRNTPSYTSPALCAGEGVYVGAVTKR